jgi:hypothetical protein
MDQSSQTLRNTKLGRTMFNTHFEAPLRGKVFYFLS